MAKKKASQQKGSGAVALIRPCAGDAIVTALWVLSSSFLGELAAWLDVRLPAMGGEYAISIVLLLALLLAFGPICSFFWGAIFNPVNNLALVVSGKGQPLEHVLRMGSQVLGALAGSYAAKELVPAQWQGKFHYNAGGLKEGILLEHGFACEVVLALLASLLLLASIDMTNKALAFWVPLLATAIWCHLGSGFTGPSMNPSIALSWNWHYQKHTTQEHLVVFWLAPFTGAAAAGLVHRWLTRNVTASQRTKQRKAAAAVASPTKKSSSKAATPLQQQEAAAAPVVAAATAAAASTPVSSPAVARAKNSRASAAKSNGTAASHLRPADKDKVELSNRLRFDEDDVSEEEHLRTMAAAALAKRAAAKAGPRRGPAVAAAAPVAAAVPGAQGAAGGVRRRREGDSQEQPAGGGAPGKQHNTRSRAAGRA